MSPRNSGVKLDQDMAEFASFVEGVRELRNRKELDCALDLIGKRLRHLLGRKSTGDIRHLSETGTIAQLIDSAPNATVWMPYRQLMLICLLNELGDACAEKYPNKGGRGWHLRALNLLMDALALNEFENLGSTDDLLPKVEDILTKLVEWPLPKATQVRVIRELDRRARIKEEGVSLRLVFSSALARHAKA